jgi:polysaccharide export outer membrane protein
MSNLRLTGRAVWLPGTVVLYLLVTLSSCGNTRRLTYMQGKFDTASLSEVKVVDPIIQKGDLLTIIVYSDNPTATSIYNQSLISTASQSVSGNSGGGNNSSNGGSGGGTGSSSGLANPSSPLSPGYLVDENGYIQFQGLGLMHVEGLSKSQLRDTLNSRFKDVLKNPYYTIRFLNYRFTLLGEVSRPGVFSIPGESINIFEALGLAGDLTFYGRRDSILVIREMNGKREFARLNLLKPEVIASPYFNIRQNDIIYVIADKKKIAANDQVTTRNVTIAATIISTLAIVYSIFKN